MRKLKRKSSGFTLVELLLICLIIAILATLLVVYFKTAFERAKVTECISNLKNLSSAMHIYAAENSGHFPDNLNRLTPNYFKLLPTCPSLRIDTYSPGYEVTSDRMLFTMCCKGKNHSGAGYGEDQPYYIYGKGMGP